MSVVHRTRKALLFQEQNLLGNSDGSRKDKNDERDSRDHFPGVSGVARFL